MNPGPVTLNGQHIRLEPLSKDHAPGLFEAGRYPQVWDFMSRGPAPFAAIADAERWIDDALRHQVENDQIPFAYVRLASETAIGSSRYLDIRRTDRAIEVGWTWLHPDYWRTAVNTEAKYLLLKHAFETLGAVRVQLKTDVLNVRSRRAIERIGCVQEGILRSHLLRDDGCWRDSVYYSLLNSEWPAAKAWLKSFLVR